MPHILCKEKLCNYTYNRKAFASTQKKKLVLKDIATPFLKFFFIIFLTFSLCVLWLEDEMTFGLR